MNELYKRDHIAAHIAALQAEATQERVAAHLRRRPALAAGFDRPGIRGSLGRALIALGSAIAASGTGEARTGSNAGHAA
jgi:hypothetical protein